VDSAQRGNEMNIAKVLVVEDEAPVREMIRFILVPEGIEVLEAADAREAEKHMEQGGPALILMDWMLPGGTSGVEYARRLKKDPESRGIPIIMLTARAEEDDKIKGLESGADDYITKPFSPRELIARIRAVLRRSAPHLDNERIVVDRLSLDPVSHRVVADANEIDLGPTEYRLLHFLMAHQERVYSRSQLLDQIWGMNVYIGERTVDVHVRRLRKALEDSGFHRFIQTVRGSGYRFSSRIA